MKMDSWRRNDARSDPSKDRDAKSLLSTPPYPPTRDGKTMPVSNLLTPDQHTDTELLVDVF